MRIYPSVLATWVTLVASGVCAGGDTGESRFGLRGLRGNTIVIINDGDNNNYKIVQGGGKGTQCARLFEPCEIGTQGPCCDGLTCFSLTYDAVGGFACDDCSECDGSLECVKPPPPPTQCYHCDQPGGCEVCVPELCPPEEV